MATLASQPVPTGGKVTKFRFPIVSFLFFQSINEDEVFWGQKVEFREKEFNREFVEKESTFFEDLRRMVWSEQENRFKEKRGFWKYGRWLGLSIFWFKFFGKRFCVTASFNIFQFKVSSNIPSTKYVQLWEKQTNSNVILLFSLINLTRISSFFEFYRRYPLKFRYYLCRNATCQNFNTTKCRSEVVQNKRSNYESLIFRKYNCNCYWIILQLKMEQGSILHYMVATVDDDSSINFLIVEIVPWCLNCR